jgi:hypothetical protein
MFQRFTERARGVIARAQDEALRVGDASVSGEHILVGLLREEEGLASQLLEGLGVDAELVSERVGAVSHPERVSSRPVPFSEHAKRALEQAVRQALSLGHDFIGTEHLLLGLLCVQDSDAARTLRGRAVSYEAVRARIALHSSPGMRGGRVAKGRPSRAAPQRSRDPRETLLAHLARQRDPTPDLSTVRILKERARPERRVFAVSFQGGANERHLWFVEVRRTPDGSWRSQAASGGPRPAPFREGHWIHLEGWSEDGHFCMGGELLREAEGCESRLALPDGTELIDDVSNGVVLFLAERALEQSAVVHLYDSAGALIASQPAF